MIPYRLRPGGGFMLLGVVVALCVAFFAWGLVQPDLDVVWRLQLELRLGRRAPLKNVELDLLQRALCRHPRLADDLLEEDPRGLISANRHGVVENGWAYLIRPAGAELELQVLIPPGAKKQHLKVRVRTVKAKAEGTASADEPYRWIPPGAGKCPTLIEVRTSKKSDDGKRRSSALIGLGAAP